MPITWDEAIDYAQRVAPEECARAGVPVGITDPDDVAFIVRMLRLGRRNHLREKINKARGSDTNE